MLALRKGVWRDERGRTIEVPENEFIIRLRNMRKHPIQRLFVKSKAKRVAVKAGRRGGKTVGVAQRAVKRFARGRRQLYAVPTAEQVNRFWFEVKRALAHPLDSGKLYKNESEHIIEVPGTEQRIRAKTAWNADTLRGDYADDLYLDEWQLMDETAWDEVGAPMLLDHDGDAVFIFTPPSIRTRAVSKARDKLHANKMFKRAKEDTSGRWATFHFSSLQNPFISKAALAEITKDMTELAYRQEILADDVDDNPNALWDRELLATNRVDKHPPLIRIIVAIDPEATDTLTSAETGIMVGGIGANGHGYLLRDASCKGKPERWASEAVTQYHVWNADRIVAEANNGGDMVERVIRIHDMNVSYKSVHASRGKAIRAEPILALDQRGLIHHVGTFGELEDQLCTWVPGSKSPDRLDARVWLFSELMIDQPYELHTGRSPLSGYRG